MEISHQGVVGLEGALVWGGVRRLCCAVLCGVVWGGRWGCVWRSEVIGFVMMRNSELKRALMLCVLVRCHMCACVRVCVYACVYVYVCVCV